MIARGKLIFLCPSLRVGGAEKSWINLIPQLTHHGFQCEVICLDELGTLGAEAYERGLIDIKLWDNLGSTQAARSLAKLAHGTENSILISRGVSAHVLAFGASQVARRPWVINWHRPPALPMTTRQQLIMRSIARRASVVIGVDQSQSAQLRNLGFKRPLFFIPNGVGAPTGTRSRSSRTTGGEFNVVLVASLRPEKRVDVLLEALVRCRKSGHRVSATIVGDGPMRSIWQELNERYGSPADFVGEQHGVGEYLLNADCLVSSSDHEAAPLNILEAMAARIPIIATQVGGVPDILARGDAGVLVPKDDPVALAEALGDLMSNEGLLDQLAESAWLRHSELYSVEVMACRYRDVLGSLTSAGSLLTSSSATSCRDYSQVGLDEVVKA